MACLSRAGGPGARGRPNRFAFAAPPTVEPLRRMPMSPLALAPVLALLAHAAPEPVPLADAPAGWRPAVERAREAAADFQQRLQGRLAQALGAGGPAAAVAVCHDDAPRI